MRGGSLPPALLCAALAFALAFAPRRVIAPSLVALTAAAALTSLLPIGLAWREHVFIACWAGVVFIAALVHLPAGVGERQAPILGAVAGILCGAVVEVAGTPGDLLKALPFVLLVLPARWLVATKRQIAVKVAASWLIAVAILAAALPIEPTPGYEPDHME